MRPRWLYGVVFCWISLVGGRFIAIFLEDQLQWDASDVGSVLAAAQGIGLLVTACWSGAFADKLEHDYPGYGRGGMVVVGISLGTLAFSGHALCPVRWFWGHAVLRWVYAVASAMVFPAMDGMCLEYLSREVSNSSNNNSSNNSQAYGQERLWGAITWGITNMVLAIGLDRLGFSIMYWMSLAATAVTLVIVFCYTTSQRPSSRVRYMKRDSNLRSHDCDGLDDGEDDEHQLHPEEGQGVLSSKWETQKSTTKATSALQILQLIGSTFLGASFMLAQVTQSSGQAIVDQLVFLYFGDELGSSYTVMGATVVLTVIFEIPIFYIAPALLKKWGPEPLIPLAAASYVSRVIGYSLLTNPIHILWLEPLHGITYACMATAGVEIVVNLQKTLSQSPSPALSATAERAVSTGQSALQVLTGFGSISGLMMGGWLQEIVGPRIMYRVAGLVVSIGASIFTAAWLRRQELIIQQPHDTSGFLAAPVSPTRTDHRAGMIPLHGIQREGDIIENRGAASSETVLEMVSLVDHRDNTTS